MRKEKRGEERREGKRRKEKEEGARWSEKVEQGQIRFHVFLEMLSLE